MKDALRRIKGMMSKNKGPKHEIPGGRAKSMPVINCPPPKAVDPPAKAADDELSDIVEEGPRQPRPKSKIRHRASASRAKSPSKAGLLARMTRNSAPALVIPQKDRKSRVKSPKSSIQEPIIAEMISRNVNQLKAVPFSLSEKMSRWCKRSPMALTKSHRPPEDHHLEFPAVPYEDKMCDEYGRNIETLARDRREGVPKHRDELVLKMYPPNRHGILNSFDRAKPNKKAKDTPGAGAAVTIDGPSKPPPMYGGGGAINSNTRRLIRNTSDKFDEDGAVLGKTTKIVSKAGGKPAPPKRVPTNISMVPQRTMSNLNEQMIAELTENMAVF